MKVPWLPKTKYGSACQPVAPSPPSSPRPPSRWRMRLRGDVSPNAYGTNTSVQRRIRNLRKGGKSFAVRACPFRDGCGLASEQTCHRKYGTGSCRDLRPLDDPRSLRSMVLQFQNSSLEPLTGGWDMLPLHFERQRRGEGDHDQSSIPPWSLRRRLRTLGGKS